MKESSRLKLAGGLTAICAVIWSTRAVLDIVYQTYNESMLLFVLDILCAAAWITACTANMVRCFSKKEKQQSKAENGNPPEAI